MASSSNEARAEVPFCSRDSGGAAVGELPLRRSTRPQKLTASQRVVDVLSDSILAVFLGSEYCSWMHDSSEEPVCLSVVRRQRAGRLVIPVAAQSHGDGGTRSLDVSVGAYEEFRLMSQYLTHGAQ